MPDRTLRPPTQPYTRVKLPPKKTLHISPNVRLHLIVSGDLPITRVLTLFNCGTVSLPGTQDNNAHRAAMSLMAGMMPEGAAGKDAATIADNTDFNGAWLQPMARARHTGLLTLAPNDTLPQMLHTVRQMMLQPDFPQQRLQAATNLAATRRREMLERVLTIAGEKAAALSHGQTHPYLNPLSPDQVQQITRDQVVSLYNKIRAHVDTDIIAGGSLDDNLIEQLQLHARAFADITGPETIKYGPATPFAPHAPGTEHMTKDGARQSAVVCTLPLQINRTDPAYIPLHMTVAALGGHFGSRLMTQVRERQGLTYGINATLTGTPEGTMLTIAAQCDKANTARVIDAIGTQMRDLATNPPAGAELAQLKAHLASTLVSTLGTPFSVMDHYFAELAVGLPPTYFDDRFDTLDRLTPDLIADTAARHLDPDQLRVVTAG